MPQFQSPGARAGNAIEEFLMQRELAERDRMEQEFRRKQEEARLQLQQQQEMRIAEAQRQQQVDMERQRGFQRASTIASAALPGDPVDAATAGQLREHGFGGQIQQGQPTQGAHLGVDENSVDQYAVTPGILQMRGGSQYMNAQAQREAAAANAEANRVAAAERAAEAEAGRNERASESNALRASLATGMGSLREETAQLRNDALRQANEQRQAKIDEDKKWREKTGEDAKRVTQNAYDLATRLETHPGLNKSQGAYEMRGFTQDAQDFRGIRAQLVAALALPNLGALKGPMSDKDIVFVKNLATRLENDKLSEGEVLQALREARNFLIEKGAVSGGGGGDKLSAADLIKKYGQ